jgi:hypothetical protein
MTLIDTLIGRGRTMLRAIGIGHRPKVFCISFQRTGTTSVGKFFADHGHLVATWHVSRANEWSLAWMEGDHERIFRSPEFNRYQVFEDDPWWISDFYKVLFHRFPDARFVILERDADRWFDSMVSHSKGHTLGNSHLHAQIYDRGEEYAAFSGKPGLYSRTIDNLLPLDERHREHYKRIYNGRNREVLWFFERFGPERLFHGRLEDPTIWRRMGEAFGIQVADTYTVHANASAARSKEAVGAAGRTGTSHGEHSERTT